MYGTRFWETETKGSAYKNVIIAQLLNIYTLSKFSILGLRSKDKINLMVWL